MRMTIHPLFLPFLFGMVLYGNVSYYALILTSLIVHELGHLVVAYLLKVKVERCVIMPYGGEIELAGKYSISPQKHLLIALGGPIATFCCLLISPIFDPLIASPFMKIQLLLLIINLIPVWPLDGGRIVFSFILIFYKKARVYEIYLAISFFIIMVVAIISFMFLPATTVILFLSIFVIIKIVEEWRFRKYRIAFEKHVMKRLT